MKEIDENKAVYRVKMGFACLTVIAAWCGPVALYFYVFH